MTIPSTTPGGLGRVRAWISRTSLLAALLATATVAVSGALAAANAQAARPPDGPRTYKVTADVDGRSTPSKGNVEAVDFLLQGQQVPIECQRYGGLAYGSRLWDLVTRNGVTLFVPDRFIDTGTNGRAPDIRRCDLQDGSGRG